MTDNGGGGVEEEATDLFCAECAMHKTLWLCLTCGFVGCGRYSNKHSVAHFQETNHPYSLELATLRIWDYVHGEYGGYAHRADLLECPSSPPLSYPWIARSRSSASSSALSPVSISSSKPSYSLPYAAAYAYASSGDTEKSPKKATMIGEEYEALLQSALEDQAQHYEGEITRLRAELTAAVVDQSSMAPEEQKVVEAVRGDIDRWRNDIDHASRDLLDVQAQEAGHRATSQRLLSGQQEANELLKEIEEEAQRENERGKCQVEDLELQVRDLTANLRMRQQFSQSEELNEAQIFGTTTSTEKAAQKRGKKKGRFFRK
jgi:BRCA1-associated protein